MGEARVWLVTTVGPPTPSDRYMMQLAIGCCNTNTNKNININKKAIIHVTKHYNVSTMERRHISLAEIGTESTASASASALRE